MSLFEILLAIGRTWGVALALCWWAGWGLAALLTPPSLRPWRLALGPLLGYCGLIWLGYNAVHSGLSLRQALPLALGLPALLNGLALRRLRRQGDLGALRPALGAIFRHPLPWLALAAAVVGVLPLLNYRLLTAIGGGWDTESYLALAQHLQDHSLAGIPTAAPSPLRDHVTNPPIIGLTMGMSIIHGWVALLAGETALGTFAPLLAWLRVLGFVGVYIWLRGAMGLTRAAALLGTALGLAGALLLWITYFNFGMQLGGWPLVGLVLALSVGAALDVAARRWRAWPSVLGAALAWAAVPLTYYPALTVVVPMAAGLALALCAEERFAWPRLKAVGATLIALVIVTLPLTTWALSDYQAGFAYRYANDLTQLVTHFVPVTDVVGTSAYLQAPTETVRLWEWAGLALAAGLAAYGLAAGPLRARWALALLGGVAYLLWARLGREYAYGYVKGAGYVQFVLMGIVAVGWQALSTHRDWRRSLGALGAATLAVTVLLAQARLVADHWPRPPLVTAGPAELARVADELMPRDAPVYIATTPRWNGPQMSVIAGALYPRPLQGHLFAAYSNFDAETPGSVPAYSLLSDGLQPLSLGLPPATKIWEQGGLTLWETDAEVAGWWRGRTSPESVTFLRDRPAGLAYLGWGGPLQMLTPTPRTWELPTGTARTELLVAASAPATLTLNAEPLALPAGVTRITSGAPGGQLTVASDSPVALVRLTALSETTRLDPAASGSAWVTWQPTLQATPEGLKLDLAVANPTARALQFELTIAQDQFGGAAPVAALIPAPITTTAALELTLPQGTVAGAGVSPLREGPLSAGRYWVALAVIDGAERLQTVPLATFSLSAGAVTDLRTLPAPVEATHIPWEGDPNQLAVGADAVALAGVRLAPGPYAPGDEAQIELLWRSITPPADALVSVQVLGPEQTKIAQWDGALGGWHPSANWLPGALVRQAVPLALAPDAPAGEYQVALVVYRASDGTPYLIDGQPLVTIGRLTVAP